MEQDYDGSAQTDQLNMREDIWSPAKEIGLPQDLRVWVEEKILLNLVLNAVQSVCEGDAGKSTPDLPAGLPRTLLAILIYSYALGVYGSAEIEARVPADPNRRYLSAGARPTWHYLRRFRRQNKCLVQDALGKTYQIARECRRRSLPPRFPTSSDAYDIFLVNDFSDAERQRFVAWAAVGWINRAVMWDSMALDE